MRLDKRICKGGRLNDKKVTGIKINGYYIYPNIRNIYLIYSTGYSSIDSPTYNMASSNFMKYSSLYSFS